MLSLNPFPISASAMWTTGLSRRSSVPTLKLNPRIPTSRWPNSVMDSTVILDLTEITARDGLEHGQLDVIFAGPTNERSQVLREARTAIG